MSCDKCGDKQCCRTIIYKQGEKGEVGARGPQGTVGPTGATGATGANGTSSITHYEGNGEPDKTVSAATTADIGTALTILSAGTYLINYGVTLNAAVDADWLTWVRNVTSTTNYLTGRDVGGENMSGASVPTVTQNGSNSFIVTLAANDQIIIQTATVDGDVVVTKYSISAIKLTD